MRVISKARLKEFWEFPGHEDAEGPLRAWYTHVNSKTVSWQVLGRREGFVRQCEHRRRLHRVQYRRQQVPAD